MFKKAMLILLLAVFAAGCGSQSSSHKEGQGPTSSSDNASPVRIFSTGAPDLAGGPEGANREPNKLTLAQLREKYKSHFILQGPSSPPRVALTFDDVPDKYFTIQVLNVLKEHNVKATFFVVGNRAEAHPDVVKRMVDEGHVLGNHSYTHANLPKVNDKKFQQEVNMTQDAVQKITGKTMTMIRPPYGNVSEEQVKWLASQGLLIVNWNVDSLDWKGLNADQVVSNVMSHIGSGAIVLQHAAGGTGEDLTGTVEALPRIIKQLRNQGIELVTVPVLLGRE
ncbi:MAG: polysaccharide deacetylase family protein [Paenibacillus sp.]|nr:polysaccharide deacetylase family protein [Paenibacillus sp.]